MTRLSPRFILPVGALATALTLTACGGSANDTSQPAASSGMGSMPGASTGSMASTAPGVIGTPAAGEHNAADAMFATMMIPHHAQAVKMSEMILAKSGIDLKITELATKIKAAQGPEIEQMRGWLAGWAQPVPAADVSMADMGHSMPSGNGMNGMMSNADMAELEAAKGADAARMFLTA